jgi:hypothetical protein
MRIANITNATTISQGNDLVLSPAILTAAAADAEATDASSDCAASSDLQCESSDVQSVQVTRWLCDKKYRVPGQQECPLLYHAL